MADISIDEAKAKIWLANVKQELDAVEVVLKDVQTSLQTIPGENDTIMQGIYKLGTSMEEKWTGMCNQFKETSVELGKLIGLIAQTATTVVDGFISIIRLLGL